ncbi:hypothetical protein RJ641_027941 [Dillenia turbinata]|uniref:Uncharacterized protein n=1 Tax=Dillenia turbinata TaxID=194707 RepID=A0AAN8VYD1_9MAGN
MPRQSREMEALINGSCKIRKRGCTSPSSSSSSVVHNYRLKKAIVVGKRSGLGLRSSTPVPTWRLMMNSRSPQSPKCSERGGKGKIASPPMPVSARKLAATLWEMNEMPSPKTEMREKGNGKERNGNRSIRSGSLPPHLSDPSHSPVSERMDRSGTGSRYRRTPSVSQTRRLGDYSVGVLDSVSNGSLMEVETRSRTQTPSGSIVGVRNGLKDVSNALTTSKELLKIINRIWGQEDRHSSSMSLVSALHAELERARLQVNHLIQEQRSERNEINYLIKCFAEEKAQWKSKERETIEAAVDSIAGELEIEKKLRRRFESLNKKLGKELAETKEALSKAVKELESEKRAREVMEKMCDKLFNDIGFDKAQEDVRREAVEAHEEVEKEGEMLQIANLLRRDRSLMKLSDAKYQLEEKVGAADSPRTEIQAILKPRVSKDRRYDSLECENSGDLAAYLSKILVSSLRGEAQEDDGEVEDGVHCEEDSAESELHSIELNVENKRRSYDRNYSSGAAHDLLKLLISEDIKGRKSTTGRPPRRSTSLQRSASDCIERSTPMENFQNLGARFNLDKFSELQKQARGKDYGDDLQAYKSIEALGDHVLPSSRIGSARSMASPSCQKGEAWPYRDPCNLVLPRPSSAQGSNLKAKAVESKSVGQNARRLKR